LFGSEVCRLYQISPGQGCSMSVNSLKNLVLSLRKLKK